MIKIAYFETGRSHDRAIDQFDQKIDKIPIWKVKRINLMKYDIIVIAAYTNQDVLSKIKKRLEQFVYYGGIVVALGVCEDKTKWLPYCTYHLPYLEKIEFENTDRNEVKKLFKNLPLNMNTFKFHDGFIAHGYFTCNEDMYTPLIVGKNTKDLIMAVIEPKSAAGKFFITTLDPDFHGICGYAKERMPDNKDAQTLFQNIIQWAIEEGGKQNIAIKKLRILLWISKTSLILIFLLSSIGLCFLSIVAFLLGLIKLHVFVIISSISSILSLAFGIFKVIEDR